MVLDVQELLGLWDALDDMFVLETELEYLLKLLVR